MTVAEKSRPVFVHLHIYKHMPWPSASSCQYPLYTSDGGQFITHIAIGLSVVIYIMSTNDLSKGREETECLGILKIPGKRERVFLEIFTTVLDLPFPETPAPPTIDPMTLQPPHFHLASSSPSILKLTYSFSLGILPVPCLCPFRI